MMKKILSVMCCLMIVFSLVAVNVSAQDTIITNENYSENVEKLEKELNGDNIVSPTDREDKTFGIYGRLHFDGWNASLVDYKADGMHITMQFKAKDGYKLPANLDSRFVYCEYDYKTKPRYEVKDDIATLDFYASDAQTEASAEGGLIISGGRENGGIAISESRDSYYAPSLLVYVAGIKNGEEEASYLKDYVFASVLHKANWKTGYLGYEHTISGIDFRLDGSCTYLVKKNTQLKVYTRQQDGFAPMEVENYSNGYKITGVTDSPDATDYSNRYVVFTVKNHDVSWQEIFYQPTFFTVNIYNYNTNQWVRVGAYDYYHENHEIKIADLLNESFQLEGKQITSFNVQTYVYDQTISQTQKRQLVSEEVDVDYALKTQAKDFNVQWTNTGVDKINGSEDSSLRIRQGDLYVAPRFTDELTVNFVDHDGSILKSETVLKGHDATAPTDPTREDFEFTGWDRDFTDVQENLTVTAQYEQTVFTVIFVDHDGTVLNTQKVTRGDDAIAPVDPAREGYDFTGWNSTFTNVQRDLTVTAMYAPIPEIERFTVTFMDHDGTVLGVQNVVRGEDAIAPTDPTREGYRFTGWNNTFINIQSDLTVTAQYEEIVIDQPPVVVTPTPVAPAPAAPATPVAPVAAVAAAPVAPVAPAVETVEDNATPLAEDVVEDNTTPLAKAEGTWALVNLICAIVTVLFGFILLISKKKKEEDEDDEYEEEPNEKKRGTFTRVLSVITAIISVIAFILTEDMTLKMIMVDKWTIMMLVITVIQIVIFAFGRKWKDNDDKDQQAYQQA